MLIIEDREFHPCCSPNHFQPHCSKNSKKNTQRCAHSRHRGGTPTTGDDNPSHNATEPILSPPASIGLKILPGGDETPTTPAQIGADPDGMDAAIKESMEHIKRYKDAPVPPMQTAAAHKKIESAIKNWSGRPREWTCPCVRRKLPQALKIWTK